MLEMNVVRPALSIVQPAEEHRKDFLGAVQRSTGLHESWVKAPESDDEFSAYLDRLGQPDQLGYLLVSDSALVGVVNVSNIRMGSLCSGEIGYYAFSGSEGRGLMFLGMQLVLERVFGPHGLHRVEASIQPENARSIRLVERLGFRKEGVSERYRRVAGEWRDHERWALIAENFHVDQPSE